MDPTDACAICMEPLTTEGVPLNCGHLYHAKCVIPWLQSGGGCPTCRDKPQPAAAASASLGYANQALLRRLYNRGRADGRGLAQREAEQRADERTIAFPRRTPTMDGFKAFGHVERPVVKERINCQNRLDQLRRSEDPTLAPAHPIGDRTDRLQNVNHMVRTELTERWGAMPEIVKTQWEELAVEATARGRASCPGLRQLLKDEPHMMPGTSF